MNRATRSLPLYLSAPHPCSYLPGRQSSTLFADPEHAMDPITYGELLQFGFRRSGRLVYAPRCEQCRQCVSVRIPVDDFEPRRNQRRVLQANKDVVTSEQPASFNDEHYALYQAYTAARHEDGDMASASPTEYLGFLSADWCNTRFLEFRSKDALLAVAVTDLTASALSAVYTFFDPRHDKRSLGTLAILTQIEWARARGLQHLYLGYWVRDCRKMAYKGLYRPLEIWREGAWQRFEQGQMLPNQETG